jgi:hypothetical protein
MILRSSVNPNDTATANGERVTAEARYRRSLEIAALRLGADHRECGFILMDLGRVLEVTNDHDVVEAAYARTIRVLKCHVAVDHPHLHAARAAPSTHIAFSREAGWKSAAPIRSETVHNGRQFGAPRMVPPAR